MNFATRLALFLLLNFAALGIGGWLMGEGPGSDWYQSLNKAPWTPPGWVFGAAWGTLMICFAVYMAHLTAQKGMALAIGLYIAQWILNVAWNPVFFGAYQTAPALAIILALTVVVALLMWVPAVSRPVWRLWILPYLVWLLLASSLNAYVVFMN